METSTAYFKPAPALTFATVAAQHAQFVTLLATQPATQVYCDLSDVRSCDSAGLALLIDMKRLCHKQNSLLMIEHASMDVLALAKLYGVEKILDNEKV